MLRKLAKATLVRAGRTAPGKHAIHAAVLDDPGSVGFGRVGRWPDDLTGFEDLAFLFSSNQLNHGIASLQFDEAAYLYKLVRGLARAPVVEIGRFRGGGTLLLASALSPGSRLWSYDVVSEHDVALRQALSRYKLEDRVELVVGDSRVAEAPPNGCDLVFIDGDHTYDGARADYVRWRELVRPGGHLLFHDAIDAGRYGNVYPGVARLVAEIVREDGRFAAERGSGTVAHFVRREA